MNPAAEAYRIWEEHCLSEHEDVRAWFVEEVGAHRVQVESVDRGVPCHGSIRCARKDGVMIAFELNIKAGSFGNAAPAYDRTRGS